MGIARGGCVAEVRATLDSKALRVCSMHKTESHRGKDTWNGVRVFHPL